LSEAADFERLSREIQAFSSPGIQPGLERTSRLLQLLGSPEREFRSIQLLGTNGKGSTAATIESICLAAGLRTALYTSPHLVSLSERLRIAGERLPIETWRGAVRRVEEAVESDEIFLAGSTGRPTFFESLTAACVLMMRNSGVDIAVIEAGMGGRYDATSVCGASAALITPIGMDHMEYLGDTLEAIASEKFAAIRPGVPAFYAADDERLSLLFERECEAIGALCFLLGRLASPRNVRCTLDGTTFDFAARDGTIIHGLRTPLAGAHQAFNASNAITALLSLKNLSGFGEIFPGLRAVDERAIMEGLLSVDWPGRMEVLRRGPGTPPLILDGAHNEHGFRALFDSLRSLVDGGAAGDVGAVVFAVMRDKDLSPIADLLRALGAPVFCTEAPTRRALPAAELASQLRWAGCRVGGTLGDPLEAIDAATAASASDELVVCCGSLFLVGAVKLGISENN
jgi:dihydrofolate synthase/folylpolyglutamate synthase